MKARDIMTRNPEVVTADESVTRVAMLMERLDVGCVPVVENLISMRLRGLVTDRDLVLRHVAKGHLTDCTVSRHMTHAPVQTVHPEADIEEVLTRMKAARVRRIPVVERSERLVGIISLADLAVRFGPEEPVAVETAVAAISEPAHPWRSTPAAARRRPTSSGPMTGTYSRVFR